MINTLPTDDGIIINPNEETIRNYFFWTRFFRRFAEGDIIRFKKNWDTIYGVFHSSYKMTDEQIHILIAEEWIPRKRLREYLIFQTEWDKAVLIKRVEECGGYISAIEEWKKSKYPKTY